MDLVRLAESCRSAPLNHSIFAFNFVPTIKLMLKIAREQIEESNPKDLALALCAIAAWNPKDELSRSFLDSAAPHVLRKINDFNERNLATVLWAIATIQQGKNRQIFESAASVILERIGNFGEFSLAQIAFAFAAADVHDAQIFSAIASESVRILGEFKANSLTILILAFARLNIRDVDLLTAVSIQACNQMKYFTLKELKDIIAAFDQFHFKSEHFEKAGREAKWRLASRNAFIICLLTLVIFVNFCEVIKYESKTSEELTSIPTEHSIAPHEYDPPEFERPFKHSAIFTIFDAGYLVPNTYNMHYANALILAYSLNETTKFPDADFEIVVAFTGNLSKSNRESLRNLGVRLVRIPSISLTFGAASASPEFVNQCNSCLSKVHLFGMTQFSTIVYLDPHMFVRANISSLLQYAPSISSRKFGHRSARIAAVPSLMLGPTVFDTSVLVFRPCGRIFRELLTEVIHFGDGNSGQDPIPIAHSADQRLFNKYFTRFIALTAEFNVQHPRLAAPKRLASTVAVQASFWTCPDYECNSAAGADVSFFKEWREVAARLFWFQTGAGNLEKSRARSDVGVLPETRSAVENLVRANMIQARFVIYSVMVGGHKSHGLNVTRVLANRKKYVNRYKDHVAHFVQDKLEARSAVWQKARDADMLLEKGYDWIWLLDASDAFIMNGDLDVRDVVAGIVKNAGQDVDILIARDFNGLNAGSFFIRNSKWTREQFIPSWKKYENGEENLDEQAAIIDMLRRSAVNIHDHLYALDRKRQNLFNSFAHGPSPTFQKGDFILHAASLRWNGMLEYMAEQNLTEF
ncbi:hypothetical protein HK100_000299 [Physocladia obscura]|uniref:RNA-editing substrate-binding complex 6 protein domain-containing protein n=1 Tax=Physocladia obscura TaxID=109957 RepID=A0AAD5SYJ3_9FUNG|nr:hypothetical protein HK100_000299 [Physocladia obscura]